MRVRTWWGVKHGLLGIALTASLSGCASIPFMHAATPVPDSAEKIFLPEDDDVTQLIAQLRSDLNRSRAREVTPVVTLAPKTQPLQSRDSAFAGRARALFAPLSGSALHMPVVGVGANNLEDSWHAPRDGGHRVHRGIDIFASRGTAVVAVADGIVSYIGDQRLAGHCLWLTTDSGTGFFYAHLDRWAPGLYEGVEVRSGDLLGYVGNTGNAIHTPPHLHFAINQNDEMVDPYPLLTKAVPVERAHLRTEVGGGSYATR